MSKRADDFQEQAEKYADDVWKEDADIEQKCITMTDYFAGAEYGYQCAVEKACEWLETHLLHAEADGYMTTDLFKQFKQFMED